MHKIDKHLQNLLNTVKTERICVACSGGMDSMVLLNALLNIDMNLNVLHVNYHLRGQDSLNDEAFIKDFCSKRNIPYFIYNVTSKENASLKNGNLQQKARNIRYRFFNEFNDGKTLILLAHHLDDQIETFFMQMARGGSIMGLSSMLEKNGNIIRPLLPFRKSEIHAYAIMQKIVWREDVSNSSYDYTRNKLRHIFIPEMLKTNKNLFDDVQLLIACFQEEQFRLEALIKPLSNQIIKTNWLSFSAFDALNDVELRELLRQIKISKISTESLQKLRLSDKGKILVFSSTYYSRVIREENGFFFESNHSVSETIPILHIERTNKIPVNFDKNVIYLDPNKIIGNLKIRKWEIGDRIKPIGINGSKLISDLLKDEHVPHFQRKNQWVVCDDIKIIWCVGHAISREALTKGLTNYLKVSVD
jgi:tRNA(Ile)-lysidine synthase